MPLYTFYPCDCDGVSNTFEAHELPPEAKVADFALKVLLEHPSCDYVEVWQGERYVLTKGYRQAGAGGEKPPGLAHSRGLSRRDAG